MRRRCQRGACPRARARVVWDGVVTPVRVLSRRLERLRGLIGAGPDAAAVLIPDCSDIHTHLMGIAIDVAFVDGTGRVLGCHRALGRGARLRCPGAAFVLERPASPGPWPDPGDVVAVRPCPAEIDERRGDA